MQISDVEAADQLEELLALVESGHKVAITRDGKVVAWLVPATEAVDRGDARAPIDRIRDRAEHLKLGRFDWAEWKSFRDEGRL